ncbi:MAG TPA: precorrin-6A synthase (deacetylating) [Acidimicrobiales bacterium]|jgi:precorrin-6A synthase
MRRLGIIGIGAGDPDYLTVQAIKALNRTDVFFFFDKGADSGDLLHFRHEICGRYIEHDRYRIVEVEAPERDLGGPDYGGAVDTWHEARIDLWASLLEHELPDGQCGGVLAWGDPGLYDSTLRVLEAVRLRRRLALELEVVPGISAVQALAARHTIPLNEVGGSVLVTTGRGLAKRWATGVDDVAVVMLDPRCSFQDLDDPDTTIYWGAFLGTPDETLIAGTIGERGEEIKRVRSEGRARKGWMFDTYLLRRAT